MICYAFDIPVHEHLKILPVWISLGKGIQTPHSLFCCQKKLLQSVAEFKFWIQASAPHVAQKKLKALVNVPEGNPSLISRSEKMMAGSIPAHLWLVWQAIRPLENLCIHHIHLPYIYKFVVTAQNLQSIEPFDFQTVQLWQNNTFTTTPLVKQDFWHQQWLQPRLFLKAIKCFDYKIKLLGQHSAVTLAQLELPVVRGAQTTQGASKSETIAAGYDMLTLGRSAAILMIWTQFKSQKGLTFCKFWA